MKLNVQTCYALNEIVHNILLKVLLLQFLKYCFSAILVQIQLEQVI